VTHENGSIVPIESARPDSPAIEVLFRRLVDSVRDYAIFMLDPTGHVATWNAGAERTKGYSANEIIGRHFSIFYPAEDVAAGKCEMELEGADRDGRFEDEGWRIRKDGTRFWANVVISAIRDDAGALIGFSKVTRDLTQRKRAEEEQAARLVAEQANRAKDEFLAMLGHELRNPLAPIVTALQLLRMKDDGNTREHDIIERQVKHMMRLVDDLLDVSRIARGKVELRRQIVELRTVIAKAVEVASPLFEQRRHHVAVDIVPHALVLDGDEARLTQVFSNLLANAAKYTDPGGRISLHVRTGDGVVAVDVRDEGIGIEPELLPRVFDLFAQGYQSEARSSGGLGLGLTLVRSLVELHGGKVVAHSAGPGLGSTFTVTLPVIEDPSRRTGAVIALPLQPRARRPQRVLLVDDNEDARELLADALRAAGHDVEAAADPVEALASVRRFVPQVAVLDIGLPVMDGYELSGRLRELLPVQPWMIALTGYGQERDRVRSAEAGFHEHLVKPVDLQGLLDAIQRGAERG
jgi:PAS domain S-box-containing protein